MPADALPASESPASRPVGIGSRYFPGWSGRIVIALCLLGILVLRTRGGRVDHSLVNILTLVLGFIAAMTLVTWFCFRSSYPKALRRSVLVALLGAVLVGIAVLRVEEVDGNMVPRFAWRWTEKSDSQLGRIQSVPSAVAPSHPINANESDDYPQFLGPKRDNYLPGPDLASDWQVHPPRPLWRQPIGAGWSAFAIVGGRAVTMEQRGSEEWVTCYEVDTGKPLWGHAIAGRHETTLGGIGPRSTPTLHAGRVYALGATGVLRCLDLQKGALLWQDDLLARTGLSQSEELAQVAWGRASSPLIIDDLVVVPLGGKKEKFRSLIAYQQETGAVAWEGGNEQVSYASPVEATLCGVRQIITVNESSIAGHDPASGRQLWLLPWTGSSGGSACTSQPHVLPGDRLFISKGYGVGAAVWQVSLADDQWHWEPIWESSRVLKTKFTNVTIIDGDAYGLSDGILECVDLATGLNHWKQGRYGHGQVLGVGKLLLVQAERGDVALVSATPQEFRELAKFPALDGKTWANPALSGKKLLVRNSDEAACYLLP